MKRRWTLPLAVLAAVVPLLLPAGAWAQTEATRYVAFGDSITAGVGDTEGREPPGYPPRLEQRLRDAGETDAVVANRGIGAERTPEGLERIDEVLAAEDGDVLLLMEGSNDISRGISQETTLGNLAEMARRAEARGYQVVQATVIPRIPRASVDSDNLINQRFCQALRDMAGTNGRDLADNFQAFGTILDVFDELYWDDPIDRVGHPNGPGYDLMTDVFFDVIRGNDTVPPVTGITVPNNGATGIQSTVTVRVDVWDFGAGIDLAATSLLLNGVDTGVAANGGQRSAQLVYQPGDQPLVGVVSVGLRSRDLATPPNTVDREIVRFVIEGTEFLPGDLDESGRVDGADLVRFARLFGAIDGQARYERAADFNDDGAIDGEDLAILADNFGRSSF